MLSFNFALPVCQAASACRSLDVYINLLLFSLPHTQTRLPLSISPGLGRIQTLYDFETLKAANGAGKAFSSVGFMLNGTANASVMLDSQSVASGSVKLWLSSTVSMSSQHPTPLLSTFYDNDTNTNTTTFKTIVLTSRHLMAYPLDLADLVAGTRLWLPLSHPLSFPTSIVSEWSLLLDLTFLTDPKLAGQGEALFAFKPLNKARMTRSAVAYVPSAACFADFQYPYREKSNHCGPQGLDGQPMNATIFDMAMDVAFRTQPISTPGASMTTTSLQTASGSTAPHAGYTYPASFRPHRTTTAPSAASSGSNTRLTLIIGVTCVAALLVGGLAFVSIRVLLRHGRQSGPYHALHAEDSDAEDEDLHCDAELELRDIGRRSVQL